MGKYMNPCSHCVYNGNCRTMKKIDDKLYEMKQDLLQFVNIDILTSLCLNLDCKKYQGICNITNMKEEII